MEAEAAAVIRAGLKDIVKEIQDFKTELKMEFTTFKEEIKKELKANSRILRRTLTSGSQKQQQS